MSEFIDTASVEEIEFRHEQGGLWECRIGFAGGARVTGQIHTGRGLWGPSEIDVWTLQNACVEQLGLDVDRYEWTVESGDTILAVLWGPSGMRWGAPFSSQEEPVPTYDRDICGDW